MDKVPAIVALYDINTGVYLYVNQAAKTVLGYEPSEVISGGMNFMTALIHPDDLKPLMKENQAAINAANQLDRTDEEPVKTFVYRVKHKNGSWRWIQTEGTIMRRSEDGKVEKILNVSIDVTDFKLMENKLKTSLNLLEGAIRTE